MVFVLSANNFTLKARSEPHKHLFFMIFHDKNTWRYGSRFSNNIPQNKVFNILFLQNDIECYRFKKNRQKMNGHRILKDTGRSRPHRDAKGTVFEKRDRTITNWSRNKIVSFTEYLPTFFMTILPFMSLPNFKKRVILI
jgi:hypothetical protein